MRVLGILGAIKAPFTEPQLWALAYTTALALKAHLASLSPSSSLLSSSTTTTTTTTTTPSATSAFSSSATSPVPHATVWPPLILSPEAIDVDPLTGGISLHLQERSPSGSDARFIPEEIKRVSPATSAARGECDASMDALERVYVFSLGACVFSTADFTLGEDEEPALSEELEIMIAAMTAEDPADRTTLDEVVKTCLEYAKDGNVLQNTMREVAVVAKKITHSSEDGEKPPPAEVHTPQRPGGGDFSRVLDLLKNPPVLRAVDPASLRKGLTHLSPRDKMLEEIKTQSVLLTPVPKEAPRQSVLEKKEEEGKPKRLVLTPLDLGDILSDWDVTTRVQLAFAAQNATSPSPSGSPSKSEHVQDKEGEDEEAASVAGEDVHDSELHEISSKSEGGGSNRSISPKGAESADGASRDGSTPTGTGSSSSGGETKRREPSPEITYLRFADLTHIRTTLAIAELDNLTDDDPALHKELVNKRLCFACRKTKFTLMNRARICLVCNSAVCNLCCDKVLLPAHMATPPKGEKRASLDPATLAKPINICSGCRSCLGGVSFETRVVEHSL